MLRHAKIEVIPFQSYRAPQPWSEIEAEPKFSAEAGGEKIESVGGVWRLSRQQMYNRRLFGV